MTYLRTKKVKEKNVYEECIHDQRVSDVTS